MNGKKKNIIIIVTGFFLLLALLMYFRFSHQKNTIRIYDGNWRSIQVVNYITRYIIEEGYGYTVEMRDHTELEMQIGFENSKIDVATELWYHNYRDWFDRMTGNGTIINLGKTFEAGRQFWIIPKWVAEKYNIRSVYDMKKHWKLFSNPEHPHKGIFYNCIIGWECKNMNEVKIGGYGLHRYYDVVSPASAEVLENVLIQAQKRKIPIFGYYWSPTAMLEMYKWHILEEPPYSKEIHQEIIRGMRNPSLRPIKRACAYREFKIVKAVHKDMKRKAPELVAMLKKMHVGVTPLEKTMKWMKIHDERNGKRIARYYLRQNRKLWKRWVPKKAYHKINDSLEKLPDSGD